VQLVSKISNLCDPDPPTSQTDGQTDGRTDGQHAISIPRYALVHRAVKTVELMWQCWSLLSTVDRLSKDTVNEMLRDLEKDKATGRYFVWLRFHPVLRWHECSNEDVVEFLRGDMICYCCYISDGFWIRNWSHITTWLGGVVGLVINRSWVNSLCWVSPSMGDHLWVGRPSR